MSADDGDGFKFGIVPNSLRGMLTSHEIAVYVALCWRANRAGICWPSHATLAEEAGCSVATARRALDSMVDKGIIEKRGQHDDRHGGQTSNIYHLLIWRPV